MQYVYHVIVHYFIRECYKWMGSVISILLMCTLLFLITAGHYVPAFGAEIVRSSSPYAKNLKGVGMYVYIIGEKVILYILTRQACHVCVCVCVHIHMIE